MSTTNNKVIIRSVDDYWKDYILDGLSKNYSHNYIKDKLVTAVKDEVYGQISLKAASSEPLPSSVLDNLVKQAHKKWDALCKKCSKYEQTYDIIKSDDLNFQEKEPQ